MIKIIALTEAGLLLANKLQLSLAQPSDILYKPVPFSTIVQQAFVAGEPLIFICATGIVVRTLAPVLGSKLSDPPVLVLDEMGQFVIPLISGHEGGANEWAAQLATKLAAQLVLTTANPYLAPVYSIGMGCERGCSVEDLEQLLSQCLAQANLSVDQISHINSIDIKSDELGLSKLAYDFLGGIMHNATSLCAIFNPTVNSYKRINAPRTLSGATWSPSAVTYTGNNRTHMIRVPDDGRFELRLMDGSTNPYLSQAGILAAGLDGMKNKRDPGKPLHINMYEEGHKIKAAKKLPATLLDAQDPQRAQCTDEERSAQSQIGASRYLAIPTREEAERAFDLFIGTYEAKYPKSSTCLLKDRESLKTFYVFPALH